MSFDIESEAKLLQIVKESGLKESALLVGIQKLLSLSLMCCFMASHELQQMILWKR